MLRRGFERSKLGGAGIPIRIEKRNEGGNYVSLDKKGNFPIEIKGGIGEVVGAYERFLAVYDYEFGVGELIGCRCPAHLGACSFKAGKCKGICARALFKDYLYFYTAIVGGN